MLDLMGSRTIAFSHFEGVRMQKNLHQARASFLIGFFGMLMQAAWADPPTGYTWVQTFSDDFSGSTLDTSVWNRAYRYGGAAAHTLSGNAEEEWYVNDAFEFDSGSLRIRADKRSGLTYPYSSGVITTCGHFSQKYGYFEMRVKIPSGKGLWPAFWLMPDSLVWPPEIDIFEILGNAPAVDYMTYHWSQFGVHASSGSNWSGPNFSQGYHVFGLAWMRGTLVWYVDGVERKRVTGSWLPTVGPFYIIANLAVGGSWPGSPDSATVFPAYMNIDYIKAWQYADTTFPSVNQWPTVSFVTPANNSYALASSPVALTVSAKDPDGTIARVVFYDGTDSAANRTASPFSATLTGIQPGKKIFYAQAYDNAGAFSVTSTVVNVVNADGNILMNGQFDDSLSGWYTSFSNGAAGTVTTGSGGLSGAHAAHFDFTNGGSANWYALLGQDVALNPQQPISISFMAKASRAKLIQVVLQRMGAPWDYYWSQSVNLTVQPKAFGPFAFTPTEAAGASLKFFVGGDTSDVWLDSVVCAVAAVSGVRPSSRFSQKTSSPDGLDNNTYSSYHGLVRICFSRPDMHHVEIFALSGRKVADQWGSGSLMDADKSVSPGSWVMRIETCGTRATVVRMVVVH